MDQRTLTKMWSIEATDFQNEAAGNINTNSALGILLTEFTGFGGTFDDITDFQDQTVGLTNTDLNDMNNPFTIDFQDESVGSISLNLNLMTTVIDITDFQGETAGSTDLNLTSFE